MENKIYLAVCLILVFIVMNFFISNIDYNNSTEYEYTSYYNPKKNPTKIPYEIGDVFNEFSFNDLHSFEKDKFNFSDEYVEYCYNLMNKFIYCASMESENDYQCQKLFYHKLKELENCQIINLYYSDPYKNDIFNFNNENNIQEEVIKNNDMENLPSYNVEQEQLNNTNDSNNKESNNNNNNNNNELLYRDCIEYGLTQNEYIFCTKYE